MWLEEQTNYERKYADEADNAKRQTPIKLSQQFIKDQLLRLSDQMNIKIDDLAWDQRVNDWKAEIHFLAAHIAGKRFSLPFNEIELTQDRGTENWKRIIIDKLNWFLTEDITVRKYNKYKHLDTGKSWIETKLRKILGSKNMPMQIVEWRNPDEWRYDIPLRKGAVGLTLKIGGKQVLLVFTSSDLKACEKSSDIQNKLLKYIEAKLIFE